jgi:DNA (cytosine-5)-methyltransferase 1
MDFLAVLEEIGEATLPMPDGGRWAQAGVVKLPSCQIAWRVLDAQYWGVPQRRKRIFLVADFGGSSAGEILFERESVRGDSSESGEAREGLAAGTESGAYIPSKARSLTARNDGSPCIDRGPEVIAFEPGAASRVGGHCYSDGKAPTLRAEPGDNGVTIAAGFKHKASPSAGNIGYKREVAPTLMEGQESAVAVYDMTHADEVMRPVEGGKCQTLNARMGTGGNQVPVISYAIAGNTIDRQLQNGGNGKGVLEEKSYTLNTIDRHAVAHLGSGKETVGCLMANCGTKQWLGNQEAFSGDFHVITTKTVRRLTPTECERLQGLEDGYTLINDKTCSDTARYKALGNGMAAPCADYVIRRIVEVCGDAT